MSPLTPDPYSILGVTKECKAPDIRKAYKLLALKFHPDKNQDADDTIKAQHREEFDKIQSAYDILKDDEERARYDEKARLADLRKTAAPKSNTSTPRTPKHYEVYTAEPRPNSFKSTPPPPGGKAYFSTSYSRSSYDDERRGGTRYYEEVRTPLRREHTYSDKSYEKAAKRDAEREREREAREKDKERERRKARKAQEAEETRKMEKLEKERRREERRAKEKQKSKDIKREMEDKRRDTRDSDAYIETFEEPRAERKKSSSTRKHEDKRDRERERSSHRDEPQPRYYTEEPMPIPNRMESARAYIHRSRSDVTDRGQSSYRNMPAVPTPPPAQASAFPRPEEDDARRSSARRHHSPAEAPSSSRERSHHKTSRERLDGGDPIVVNTSPGSRRGSHTAHTAPYAETSPPRLPRVNTMPTERVAPRPGATTRSQTFNVVDSVEPTPPITNRGRGRSKLHAQVPDEESDYDDMPRRRSTKHSSSKKKTRSPSRGNEYRYHISSDGRAKLQSAREGSYSRKLDPEPVYYDYYESFDTKGRPTMPSREPSYVAPMKVKMSKAYAQDDVQYSQYPTNSYQYPAATYA